MYLIKSTCILPKVYVLTDHATFLKRHESTYHIVTTGHMGTARMMPVQLTKDFRSIQQNRGFSEPVQNELITIEGPGQCIVDSQPQLATTTTTMAGRLNTPTLHLRSPSINLSTPC